eukprot:CAMPEP_0170555834 /NCGR_PEP_ID=MMETSP0211-20121228/13635_1 /TAXON_ID=311385 /ORGANISM="Pseudokeronopsis sp., Strain OXSARD2" /LENGTH=122 /DNA_ID=CAMNT_0010865835 /DNA_START=1850 /DNA_END=2218 /DNA_ORIENTATION=+
MALEGSSFAEKIGGLVVKNQGEEPADKFAFKKLVPSLKILARARPDDKYMLVAGLQNLGEVVAVIGDGTSDAPALKKADIGFAMKMEGSEVSKYAASKIVLDDSFASIEQAFSYSRFIHDNL